MLSRVKEEQWTPLLILDICKAENIIHVNRSGRTIAGKQKRSKSEERPLFRLHVMFGSRSDVYDANRKKDWVFDSELNIPRTKYKEMLKVFRDSVVGLQGRPGLLTVASRYFAFFAFYFSF